MRARVSESSLASVLSVAQITECPPTLGSTVDGISLPDEDGVSVKLAMMSREDHEDHESGGSLKKSRALSLSSKQQSDVRIVHRDRPHNIYLHIGISARMNTAVCTGACTINPTF